MRSPAPAARPHPAPESPAPEYRSAAAGFPARCRSCKRRHTPGLPAAVAAAAFWIASAASLAAQRPAAPVSDLTSQIRQYGVTLNYTHGSLSSATGNVRGLGANGGFRTGAVTLNAGLAVLDADSATSGFGAHGAIAVRVRDVLRPPPGEPGNSLRHLSPRGLAVDLRFGAGYSKLGLTGGDARVVDATMGPALSLLLPTPTLAAELSTHPRLHARAANSFASNDDDPTFTLAGGATLGAAVTLRAGFGAAVALDWLRIAPSSGIGAKWQFSFGAGLHYAH